MESLRLVHEDVRRIQDYKVQKVCLKTNHEKLSTKLMNSYELCY